MEACRVMLKGDMTRIGYAVNSHMVAVPDKNSEVGLRYQHLVEVGWMTYDPQTGEESVNVNKDEPGLAIHEAKELIFLGLVRNEEYEDEETEDDDDEMSEEDAEQAAYEKSVAEEEEAK